ncbi:MAG: GNAT family N-acetyltransferase [Siculibacillus sp.]|nr:GNAT family N-acetyltransferase [Siculibacillus sp.]
MGATRTRVRVLVGIDAVRDALAALPDELRPTAFQHASWIDCWLAGEGHSQRRMVLALAESVADGRPLFALPLVLDTFGPAAYWTALDLGVCDYNASFAAPDFRPTTPEMRSIWTRIVAALPDHADFLMIDKLPTAISGRTEPLLELPGLWRSHVLRHSLRLDADFATLRDTRFSGTTMRSLARKRRKLARKGWLTFSISTGEDALGPLERLLGWRGDRYGVRADIDAFYRRLTAAGDPARVAWLALDGEPLAACFGLVETEAFRLLAVGHDERFKNWSPGLLLIEDAIAWAVEGGFSEFDFTIGSEAYKFDFGVGTDAMWIAAEEFSPQGSAMLRLMLARNLIAKQLKRWIDPSAPRRRDSRSDDVVAA